LNEEFFDEIFKVENNLTDLSQDCLVVEDHKREIIGFSCLLKSSKRNSWQMIFHIIPEHYGSKFSVELFESILEIANKQNAPQIIFRLSKHIILYSPLQTKFKEMGLEPVSFGFMLRLDDFKLLPDINNPTNITFQSQKKVTDFASYVLVLNDAFRNNLEFRPSTEEEFKSSRRVIEKHYDVENWLAYDKKKLVGVCFSSIDPKTKHSGFVDVLGVFHKYHHRGIGSSLLNMGIHSLIEKGCKTIELVVEVNNEKALSLYTKFGFYEVRTVITYAIE